MPDSLPASQSSWSVVAAAPVGLLGLATKVSAAFASARASSGRAKSASHGTAATGAPWTWACVK